MSAFCTENIVYWSLFVSYFFITIITLITGLDNTGTKFTMILIYKIDEEKLKKLNG